MQTSNAAFRGPDCLTKGKFCNVFGRPVDTEHGLLSVANVFCKMQGSKGVVAAVVLTV